MSRRRSKNQGRPLLSLATASEVSWRSAAADAILAQRRRPRNQGAHNAFPAVFSLSSQRREAVHHVERAWNLFLAQRGTEGKEGGK